VEDNLTPIGREHHPAFYTQRASSPTASCRGLDQVRPC
jgi:hypothetical protein